MTIKEHEADFKTRIEEHKLLVLKICRMYGKTTQDREDLYQEILIQLWRAFPSFNGQAKFTTWMYRVALYTAISGLRKKKIVIADADVDSISNYQVVVDNDSQANRLNMLYKAIEQLNEIDRAIVMLYLDDRSYEEMEEIMGINQGNLRVKMNRIKDKLKKLTNN